MKRNKKEEKKNGEFAKVVSRVFSNTHDRARLKNQQICLWLIIRLIINDDRLGLDSTVRLKRNMTPPNVSQREQRPDKMQRAFFSLYSLKYYFACCWKLTIKLKLIIAVSFYYCNNRLYYGLNMSIIIIKFIFFWKITHTIYYYIVKVEDVKNR